MPADVLALVFEVFFFELAVVLRAIEDSPFRVCVENVDADSYRTFPLVKRCELAL